MKRLALIAALLGPGLAAAAGGPSPGIYGGPREIAAAMERASRTEGFRLRATLAPEGANGAGGVQAWRLLLAGTKDEHRQRLLVRVLAPEARRGEAVLLEASAGADPKAVRFGPGEGAAPADAFAPLFDSGLVPWDFFGAWWRWPRQSLVGEERLLGHPCVVIDSRGGRGPVARVRSWVAPLLRMPLRMAFYGTDGALLREIRVERVFRRADGSGAARALVLAGAAGAAVRFEVYNGEEGVALAPGTFDAPGSGKAPAEMSR